MASATGTLTGSSTLELATSEEIKRDHQAYSILHWGYVALPLLAGIDKFTMLLCNWEKYLSPTFGSTLGPHRTMQAVGIIEIVAGLGMALKPRLFAPIVMLWLWGIILNLLLLGNYYDIALRDFGLSLGALALFRLSQHFDVRHNAERVA